MINGRNDIYPDPEFPHRPIPVTDDRADEAYENWRQRVLDAPCQACHGKGFQTVNGQRRVCPACRGLGHD